MTRLTVDGRPVSASVPPWSSLRTLLDEVGTPLPAGCDAGHCGSCTVLLERTPVPACVVPAHSADGGRVDTVATAADPQLTRQFAIEGAVQCGYCTPGLLVTLSDLLRRHRGAELTADRVRAALTGNLCRCTGYDAIVRATLAAHAAS